MNKHEEEKALHPTRREISLLQIALEGADDSQRTFVLWTPTGMNRIRTALKEKIIISGTIQSPLGLLVKV